MDGWLELVIGSVAGGVARYLLAGIVYRVLGTGFPYGTLAVNLSGCFFIGLLDALAEDTLLLGPRARLLLMIGFCGAYTTFSTLLLETSHLLKQGETLRAATNVGASLLLGFLLLRLGSIVAKVI